MVELAAELAVELAAELVVEHVVEHVVELVVEHVAGEGDTVVASVPTNEGRLFHCSQESRGPYALARVESPFTLSMTSFRKDNSI